MYQKILVPLDASKRAEAILPHAVEMAQHYNAAVILLQVVEPDLGKLLLRSATVGLERMESDFQQRYWEAQTYLDDLRADLQASGIVVQAFVEHGPIIERILDIAHREEVNLIAMSSHGRTGTANVFYGSIAAGILHKTPLPLLLVRSIEVGTP